MFVFFEIQPVCVSESFDDVHVLCRNMSIAGVSSIADAFKVALDCYVQRRHKEEKDANVTKVPVDNAELRLRMNGGGEATQILQMAFDVVVKFAGTCTDTGAKDLLQPVLQEIQRTSDHEHVGGNVSWAGIFLLEDLFHVPFKSLSADDLSDELRFWLLDELERIDSVHANGCTILTDDTGLGAGLPDNYDLSTMLKQSCHTPTLEIEKNAKEPWIVRFLRRTAVKYNTSWPLDVLRASGVAVPIERAPTTALGF